MSLRIAIIENHIIATNTIRFALTKMLVEKGYEVRVFTTGSDKELELARSRGFSITDIGSSNKNPLHVWRYIRNLRAQLKTFQPALCLTFTIRPAIWGNLVTRQLNIPTITNITGTGPLFASNHPVYRAARMLYKFVLRRTAFIFFQNDEDMNLFLSHGFVSKDRAGRIPGSGVDPAHFNPQPFPANKQGLQFLFIGRLVKDKGILEFVAAARMLKAANPQLNFQVLGPVWLQNLKENIISAEEIARWEQEGLIRYLGETTDVRPYIAGADCIVLPSYREGTSNVLLEAASMERPGITCDTTGCREIVDDGRTGFLCRVADADDLAEKILRMANLSEEARRRMGAAAREKVVKEFHKQIVLDAYIQQIQRLTRRPA